MAMREPGNARPSRWNGEETPVQGKERTRDVYIHKKNNAIPNNEKAKKGNPIFTAPRPASDQLDTKREGEKGGQGDKNPQ
jgi:hypothetical protein